MVTAVAEVLTGHSAGYSSVVLWKHRGAPKEQECQEKSAPRIVRARDGGCYSRRAVNPGFRFKRAQPKEATNCSLASTCGPRGEKKGLKDRFRICSATHVVKLLSHFGRLVVEHDEVSVGDVESRQVLHRVLGVIDVFIDHKRSAPCLLGNSPARAHLTHTLSSHDLDPDRGLIQTARHTP